MLLSLHFYVRVAITTSFMPDRLPLTTVVCILNSINTADIVIFDSGAKMTYESMLGRIIEEHSGPSNPVQLHHLHQPELGPGHFGPPDLVQLYLLRRPKLGTKHSRPSDHVQLYLLCRLELGPDQFQPDRKLQPSKLRFTSLDLPLFSQFFT
ncbi:hypothetical protein Q3G72_007832 [Acer saccharum]|nr:hypothetical protein Q3G72_007832 [Acer saccharum]